MLASNDSDRANAPAVVLAVTPFPDDQRMLRAIFSRSNWELKIAATRKDAIELLKREVVPVIICEHILPDGGWRDVADAAYRAGSRPRVLVTSRCADDSLWCEVLDEGAYDCLSKPFRAEEIFRLVSLAWRSWRVEAGREQSCGVPALA